MTEEGSVRDQAARRKRLGGAPHAKGPRHDGESEPLPASVGDPEPSYKQLRLRVLALKALPLAMRPRPAAIVLADALALNAALGDLVADVLVLSGLSEAPRNGSSQEASTE